jgi:hypothetical protein
VQEHLPRSTRDGRDGECALIETIRFPRDPKHLVIEHHDVCFHFKSDFKVHLDEVVRALFTPGENVINGIPVDVFLGDLFTITTIRRGFAGRSMPRRIGIQLGIPGAEKIPEGAMLFMGFTSSHVHGLVAGNLAQLRDHPRVDRLQARGYMASGVNMHLSHIGIELVRRYELAHGDRQHQMFTPRRSEAEDVLSPRSMPGHLDLPS